MKTYDLREHDVNVLLSSQKYSDLDKQEKELQQQLKNIRKQKKELEDTLLENESQLPDFIRVTEKTKSVRIPWQKIFYHFLGNVKPTVPGELPKVPKEWQEEWRDEYKEKFPPETELRIEVKE